MNISISETLDRRLKDHLPGLARRSQVERRNVSNLQEKYEVAAASPRPLMASELVHHDNHSAISII